MSAPLNERLGWIARIFKLFELYLPVQFEMYAPPKTPAAFALEMPIHLDMLGRGKSIANFELPFELELFFASPVPRRFGLDFDLSLEFIAEERRYRRTFRLQDFDLRFEFIPQEKYDRTFELSAFNLGFDFMAEGIPSREPQFLKMGVGHERSLSETASCIIEWWDDIPEETTAAIIDFRWLFDGTTTTINQVFSVTIGGQDCVSLCDVEYQSGSYGVFPTRRFRSRALKRGMMNPPKGQQLVRITASIASAGHRHDLEGRSSYYTNVIALINPTMAAGAANRDPIISNPSAEFDFVQAALFTTIQGHTVHTLSQYNREERFSVLSGQLPSIIGDTLGYSPLAEFTARSSANTDWAFTGVQLRGLASQVDPFDAIGSGIDVVNPGTVNFAIPHDNHGNIIVLWVKLYWNATVQPENWVNRSVYQIESDLPFVFVGRRVYFQSSSWIGVLECWVLFMDPSLPEHELDEMRGLQNILYQVSLPSGNNNCRVSANTISYDNIEEYGNLVSIIGSGTNPLQIADSVAGEVVSHVFASTATNARFSRYNQNVRWNNNSQSSTINPTLIGDARGIGPAVSFVGTKPNSNWVSAALPLKLPGAPRVELFEVRQPSLALQSYIPPDWSRFIDFIAVSGGGSGGSGMFGPGTQGQTTVIQLVKNNVVIETISIPGGFGGPGGWTSSSANVSIGKSPGNRIYLRRLYVGGREVITTAQPSPFGDPPGGGGGGGTVYHFWREWAYGGDSGNWMEGRTVRTSDIDEIRYFNGDGGEQAGAATVGGKGAPGAIWFTARQAAI